MKQLAYIAKVMAKSELIEVRVLLDPDIKLDARGIRLLTEGADARLHSIINAGTDEEARLIHEHELKNGIVNLRSSM